MNVKKAIFLGVIFIIIVAAVVTVLGVNRSQDDSEKETSGIVSSPMGLRSLPAERMGESAVTDNNTSTDKKIIKNGNLTLKVNSVDKAAENIAKIAKDNGGDISSSNIYNRNNIKSGTISVKIPFANFEKTFAEIKKVAALVTQESTSGQDVTEEYIDLQAQLKNKQAEEQQFAQILGRAQKIQDILDVTEQLSRVRGEIEQLQGRIKYLNSQTDMASILINLSEDSNITITDSWRPLQVIKDAVNSLIKKAQGFINFAIVLIITVIPVAILYLLLAYIIYWIGRKIYSRLRS